MLPVTEYYEFRTTYGTYPFVVGSGENIRYISPKTKAKL